MKLCMQSAVKNRYSIFDLRAVAVERGLPGSYMGSHIGTELFVRNNHLHAQALLQWQTELRY
ncbi:hypothetical protein DPMN_076838 [Dreissena polymorpha]|uniref:Uncharacterized protein n=1 Tax=Dreissena polymorpha TaxID=45954 RepID=A0A9D3YJD7_DREPO|nr:hypothetical protein DPMN_076838 [Dreissena polymorpha]